MPDELEDLEQELEEEVIPEENKGPDTKLILETMDNRFKEFQKSSDEKFGTMVEQLGSVIEKLVPKEPPKQKTYGLDETNYKKNRPIVDLMERITRENSTESLDPNSISDIVNSAVNSAFTKFNTTDPELAAYLERQNPVTGRPIKQDYEQAVNDGDSATLGRIKANARKLARKPDNDFSSISGNGADPPKVLDAKEKLVKLKNEYIELREMKDAEHITAEQFAEKGKKIHFQVSKLSDVLGE